ncbi:multidrug and toxin extrusion protein 1-like isoform X1 [Saccoglossus kowalevskii]
MEEDSILSTYKDLRCKNCCHGNLASWRREFKEIFKLAWTTIIFTIAFGSFNVMNIIFCGHLGKKELAAASLGLSVSNFFMMRDFRMV